MSVVRLQPAKCQRSPDEHPGLLCSTRFYSAAVSNIDIRSKRGRGSLVYMLSPSIDGWPSRPALLNFWRTQIVRSKLKWQTVTASVVSVMILGCNSNPNPTPTTPAAPSAEKSAGPAAPLKPVEPATPPVVQPTTAPSALATKVPDGTVIHCSTESAARILAGTQTSTTRKGIRTFPVGPATLVSGNQQIAVEITDLKPEKFSELTEADAHTGGFETLDALKESLKKYNPELMDSDDMTVIHFQLKK
jgi:hypothetical protein